MVNLLVSQHGIVELVDNSAYCSFASEFSNRLDIEEYEKFIEYYQSSMIYVPNLFFGSKRERLEAEAKILLRNNGIF